MERKNLALLCAGVVCFWLFALAFGTAQGNGLRQQMVDTIIIVYFLCWL